MGRSYRPHRMEARELEYDLPPELIAQHPAARRDESRLLVYSRSTGAVEHRVFRELPDAVPADTLAVVNDTRVVPARIPIESPRGEVLLLEQVAARSGKRSRGRRGGCGPGGATGRSSSSSISARDGGACGSRATRPGGAPLPPYITAPLADDERYQTVYARARGSAAAPTAGLHFTQPVLDRLDVERVTLHVGLDTFRPLQAERVDDHRIHGERYEVAGPAWERIRGAERVLAVGTTTVRTLETLVRGAPLAGRTELFITPGFEFRRVDHLLTNFHLPRSTLLALVMAFAGVEETRRLYELAIEQRYRFYSFGDAMLIL